MGIYNTKTSKVPVPEITKKQIVFFAAAIIAIAILLLLATAVSEALKPKAILAAFSSNPLDLSKQQSTVLKVRVFNTENNTVENTVLRIEPIASESLIVFPTAETIPKLGSNEHRELFFTVRPHPSAKTASGSYKISIILLLGGKEYAEEAVLTIKALNPSQ